MRNYLKLIISILIPLIIGFIGSYFTSKSVDTWYAMLKKPSFNPPNWVFAPVWILLFVLIGLSFYFVWIKNFEKHVKTALLVYLIQLFLNLMWPLLFFGLQSPLMALIEIFILWLVIFANIIVFHRISKKAGFLLIPYLLWVAFAMILNLNIFILN